MATSTSSTFRTSSLGLSNDGELRRTARCLGFSSDGSKAFPYMPMPESRAVNSRKNLLAHTSTGPFPLFDAMVTMRLRFIPFFCELDEIQARLSPLSRRAYLPSGSEAKTPTPEPTATGRRYDWAERRDRTGRPIRCYQRTPVIAVTQGNRATDTVPRSAIKRTRLSFARRPPCRQSLRQDGMLGIQAHLYGFRSLPQTHDSGFN